LALLRILLPRLFISRKAGFLCKNHESGEWFFCVFFINWWLDLGFFQDFLWVLMGYFLGSMVC
jgi:hypothetical protein